MRGLAGGGGETGDRNRTKTTPLPLAQHTHTGPGKSIVGVPRGMEPCADTGFLDVTQHLLGHRMGFSPSRSVARRGRVALSVTRSLHLALAAVCRVSLSVFPPALLYARKSRPSADPPPRRSLRAFGPPLVTPKKGRRRHRVAGGTSRPPIG